MKSQEYQIIWSWIAISKRGNIIVLSQLIIWDVKKANLLWIGAANKTTTENNRKCLHRQQSWTFNGAF